MLLSAEESPLQPGDEILAVAGQKISTVRQCIGVIELLPGDQHFDILYRSSEDGQEHHFSTVRSDDRLGIWLKNLADLPTEQSSK